MRKTVITLVSSILFCSNTFGQWKKDLKIDFMLRGQIYAASTIADTSALGGYGGSDNIPRVIIDSLNFPDSGLFLKIDTTKPVIINDKFNGYKFYIGNKSDTIVQLDASDSRLYVIAEVYYLDKWQSIEYIPSSWCGNSYHKVYLRPNEYWTFNIPKFGGKINTKLRYRLMITSGKFIYSNEIQTRINKKQLIEKQGHIPNDIMDPYND